MTEQEAKKFMEDHIKSVCGPIVQELVKGLQTRATDNNPLIGRVEPGSAEDRHKLARTSSGIVFAGVVGALAKCRMDVDKAAAVAEKEWKMPNVAKALTAGVAEAGGFTIGVEHSDEIIDLLTERARIRGTISNVQDLATGSVEVSRLTESAQTSWGGEIMKTPETQQAFGVLVLRARQQKTIVPISNTLLRRGGPRVANVIRFDTLRAMSLGEDQVFLRSEGTEHRPKGLRYWAPSGNIIPMTATPDLDTVTQDLGALFLALEEAHVGMTRPVIVMAPRTKWALQTVRIPNGPFAFRDELANDRLWGAEVISTTHMPRTLDPGANKSEIILYDADEMAIGQGPQLQVSLSEEGTMVDSGGNVTSFFQQNMTGMRVISEVDFVARHAEAIAVLTGVTWAPGEIG